MFDFVKTADNDNKNEYKLQPNTGYKINTAISYSANNKYYRYQ